MSEQTKRGVSGLVKYKMLLHSLIFTTQTSDICMQHNIMRRFMKLDFRFIVYNHCSFTTKSASLWCYSLTLTSDGLERYKDRFTISITNHYQNHKPLSGRCCHVFSICLGSFCNLAQPQCCLLFHLNVMLLIKIRSKGKDMFESTAGSATELEIFKQFKHCCQPD